MADGIFEKLDVEQLRIVGSDGKPVMVIANRQRLPDAVIDGMTLPRQGPRTAGMVFFNDEGTECGGLIFSGSGMATSGPQAASGLFLGSTGRIR